jgi:class 3 adenylate cyclase
MLTQTLRSLERDGLADPGFEDWYVTHERLAASPGAGVAFLRMLVETDVRDVLPAIRVPTLLRYHDAFAADAEYAAAHIRGSERVRLTLPDLALHADDSLADDVKRFLTARSSRSQGDRVLATVLFTDLVGSTARAAEVGDAEWPDLLERFRGAARTELARFRGREIDTAGDGLFATFDGPARAIECARALVDDTLALGLELRAGVHTGECEVLAEKVAGIAVHIGARIASVARAKEVLVSSTVKDLVAGSGIAFVDSGTHSLKGVPGEWRLYAVRSAAERTAPFSPT